MSEPPDHPSPSGARESLVVDVRVRRALRAASIGLWDWDLCSNAVYFSPEWKRQIGYEDDEIRSEFGEWERRVHPDDLARALGTIRTFIARPWPDFEMEFRFRHKNGSYRWILAQASLEFNPAGQAIRMLGAHVDITTRKQAELDLRESEQAYRTLVETSNDLIWSVDAAGRWTFVNAAVREIYGCEPAEMIGRPFMDFQTPEQAEKDLVVFARIKAGATAINYETVHRRKDGAFVNLSFNAVVRRDGQGNVLGTTGTARDITAHKYVEGALRESEERFRRLIEHAPEAVVLLDIATGTYVQVNPAAERLFKRSADELCRTGPIEMSPPRQPDGRPSDEKARELLARALAGETPVFEWVHRDGEGREFSCEVRLLRLEIGGREVVRGSVTDISERKRTENALRERERELRLITNSLPGPVSRVDRNLHYLFVNDQYERVFGRPRAAVVGHTMPEVLGPELFQHVEPSIRRVLAGEAVTLESQTPAAGGGVVHWLVNYVPDRNPDRHVVGFFVIALDITARRNLEEQLRHSQKMESVGQLAGGVAHDFNNILTVIQGHVSLLALGDAMAEAARDSIAEIKQAADRAANLTRQLLTFSRRQAMRPGPLELNAVVTNMVRLLQRILGEDVSLELHLAPHDLVVLADAGMVEQVLLNLAVNSRDAMPDGGRLLIETSAVEFDDTVTSRAPAARAGAFVCLMVRDTGVGIAADVLPRIFEPFFTTKEQGKGTGLGLATAYGIVRQHQGWIDVESEPGSGSTFRVYLPRKEGAAATPSPSTAAGTTRGRGETILLVEDEPAVRLLVSKLLGRSGYRVLVAASGPQALELWRGHREEIELVLTDLVMPDGMSGFDLGAQLKRDAPGLRVIYTSGYSRELAGRDEELVAGVNYLAKPFEMEALLRTLRQALDRPSG